MEFSILDHCDVQWVGKQATDFGIHLEKKTSIGING
jgi:hypothetical protein